MARWLAISLSVCFLVAGFVWRWGFPIFFLFHLGFGIWAVTVLFGALSTHRKRQLRRACWVMTFVMTICWALTITHPGSIRGRHLVSCAAFGQLTFFWVLGESNNASVKLIPAYWSTVAPWNVRIQRAGFSCLLADMRPKLPSAPGRFAISSGRMWVEAFQWQYPVWALFVFVMIPAVVPSSLYSSVSNPYICRKCSYNLNTNQSGVCPECGASIPSSQKKTLDSNRTSAAPHT